MAVLDVFYQKSIYNPITQKSTSPKMLVQCDNCKATKVIYRRSTSDKAKYSLCQKCAQITIALEDYINLGKLKGFEFLESKITENGKFPYKWKCSNNHIFSRCYNSINVTIQCPICRINEFHNKIITILNKRNYCIEGNLPSKTSEKMILKCEFNHQWMIDFNHLKRGHGCHYCNKYYTVIPSSMTEEEKELRRDRWKYRAWREKVHKNCDYTCQKCLRRGGKLVAHHLNGYHWDKDNRFNPKNGASLCIPCHKLFHSIYGCRDNTKEQFEEFRLLH